MKASIAPKAMMAVIALTVGLAVGCEPVPTLPEDSKTGGFEPPVFHVAAPSSHGVTEAQILALINGPPAATAGVAFTVDLEGDPGIIQSAAYPMADGNFLYGYQWECHTGPNWDLLTLDVPMAGTTPVLRDIDGDGNLDDSWAITDKFGFMPYNQQPTGLQALCGSDAFGVASGDFVTGFSFSGGLVTFSNNDGIFLTSNLFGFIGCSQPQVVQTTAGAQLNPLRGSTTGSGNIDGTTAQFPVVAPTAPTLTASAAPSTMWPPNHKYVSINLSAAVSGNCGAVTFTATATSNEADNARGRGDGNTTGDIRVTTADGSVLESSNASPTVSFDPVDDQLELRAERDGRGSGREYTIVVTATDANGNSSSVTVTVTVAHDQG